MGKQLELGILVDSGGLGACYNTPWQSLHRKYSHSLNSIRVAFPLKRR